MKKLVIILGVLGTALSAILVRYSTAASTILVFYRMLFSVLLLCPVIIAGHSKELKMINIPLLSKCTISGIFLGLHFLCYFQSLKFTSVASSVVLVDTEIFFVALGSMILFREQLSVKGWLSIFLTFIGSVVVAMGDAGETNLWGDVLALCGAICSAVYTLVGRHCRKEMSTSMYTWIVYFFAGVTVWIFTLFMDESVIKIDAANLLVALGLAIFCTLLGHSIFSWGLRYEKASFISTVKLLEPVFASLMAALIFYEIPSQSSVVGGFFIILGIVTYIRYSKE